MKAARSENVTAPQPPRRGSLGRYAIFVDLLLIVAIAVLCTAIAAPALHSARQRDKISVVCAEAKKLHEALGRYYDKNRAFPGPSGNDHPEAFLLDTLQRLGYVSGDMAQYLVGERVDAYEIPRDDGRGREYWIEMSLADDSGVRLLVARSDSAPLGRGKWMDGAYLFRDGKVEPL